MQATSRTSNPSAWATSRLPGEVKVETRLTTADREQLKIGMDMELVFVPLYTDDDGNEVITFAFAPVES